MRQVKFQTTAASRTESGNFQVTKSVTTYYGEFHQWMWNQNGELYAIVEKPDGVIVKVYYENIVFISA